MVRGGTGLLRVALVPSWSPSSCQPAPAPELGNGRNLLPSPLAPKQLGQGEGGRNAVPGITWQLPRPPQGQRDGHEVLVWVPASTTGMGRCLSRDVPCHLLLNGFIGDYCFHLGTHRLVQGIMVVQLLCPSPVPCRWGPTADQGPGGTLCCHGWVKTSRSSQGTRKALLARCSAGFWQRLLPVCSIAWPAGNPGRQPEGLTWLAKSPYAGHRQSHAALSGLSRERREQERVRLSGCLSQAGRSLSRACWG